MRKSTEIELGGERYAITKYSGTKGTELFIKIVKAVGEPLSQVIEGAKDGLDSEINIELIGKALRNFSMSADHKEFTFLMKEILDGVVYISQDGNGPLNYDSHFSGRIGHLFKLVVQVIKFQYEDFLEDLAGITPAVQAKVSTKVKAL